MSAYRPRLARRQARPPVRAMHVGVGAFFRAHQAWYTHVANHSGDEAWGIAAFAGRGAGSASLLNEQGGVYTLIERGPAYDRATRIESVAAAYAAHDPEWLRLFQRASVGVVTVTVTEAGYHRRPDGALDTSDANVAQDLEALRRGATELASTAPARLAQGLAARRAGGGAPIAFVSCDNLMSNGAALRAVVLECCAVIDAGLARWADRAVSFPSTMVDRIVPRVQDCDLATAVALTGEVDSCPVVAEPFTEWVIEDRFPAGRPAWEAAGATLSVDVDVHERKKLLLLNGAHLLLAYLGLMLGHTTVDEAAADPRCMAAVRFWWNGVSPMVRLPPRELAAYCGSLEGRWSNSRIGHRLEQIAADGSQKLRVRALPALQSGKPMAGGAALMIAAWIAHLRRGVAVQDVLPQARQIAIGEPAQAVRRVLSLLAPDLSAAQDLQEAVVRKLRALEQGDVRLALHPDEGVA